MIRFLLVRFTQLSFMSVSRLLTLYNVHLRYVSPSNLGMPNEVMDYIGSKGIPQVYRHIYAVWVLPHITFVVVPDQF